jgi:hypothetical protein
MSRKKQNQNKQHGGSGNPKSVTNPPEKLMCKIPNPISVRLEENAKSNERYGEEKDARNAQLRTAQRLNQITIIAAAIAASYAGITYLQWHDANRSFLQDERAWLKGRSIGDVPQLDASKPYSMPFTITNIGKTSARDVVIEADVEVVARESDPSFEFTEPHAHVSTGIMYPGDSADIVAETFDKSSHSAPTRSLGQADYDLLSSGKAYLVFFGRVTYKDIFRRSHWTQFCGWKSFSAGQYHSRKCTDYNDTDN